MNSATYPRLANDYDAGRVAAARANVAAGVYDDPRYLDRAAGRLLDTDLAGLCRQDVQRHKRHAMSVLRDRFDDLRLMLATFADGDDDGRAA